MDISSILKNEKELAARAVKIPGDPDIPFPLLSAKLKLTLQCNLRCKMCNLWKKPPESLEFEKAVRLISQLRDKGTRKIHFSGGEVFLLPWFTDLVEIAAGKYGLQVNITTNGTLITKEIARRLVDSRVHTVIISVDSHEKKIHDNIRGRQGAFKAALEGIGLLKRRKERKGRGPNIAVNTVITRENIESVDQLHDLVVSRGIDSWRLLPVDSEIKRIRPTQKQWNELLPKISSWGVIMARLPLDWSSERSGERAAAGKYAGVFYGENICFAPWFNIFINGDGNVYPCCMGKQDMMPYGNINESTLGEVLKSSRKREIAYSMASGHIFPVCEKCDDFLEENIAFNALKR